MNVKSIMISFILVFSATFICQTAMATKFCARVGTTSTPVEYMQQAIGTQWTTPGIRKLPGIKMKVIKTSTGSTVFDGYTDQNGCSLNISTQTGEYTVRVYSEGKPNLWNKIYLRLIGPGPNPLVSEVSAVFNVNILSSTITAYVVPFTGGNIENLPQSQKMKATLWASYPLLAKLPSEFSSDFEEINGTNFIVHFREFGWIEYASSTKIIHTIRSQSTRKLKLTHEMGHAIQDAAVPNLFQAASFDYDIGICISGPCADPCSAYTCNHDTASVEFSNDSMREGWADYVSALAWNSKTSPGCEYHVEFGDEAVNCLTGSGNYPSPYFSNKCANCSSPTDPGCVGLSTELDWMRAFRMSSFNCTPPGAQTPFPTISFKKWLDIFSRWNNGTVSSVTKCNIYGEVIRTILSNHSELFNCFNFVGEEHGLLYSLGQSCPNENKWEQQVCIP